MFAVITHQRFPIQLQFHLNVQAHVIKQAYRGSNTKLLLQKQ